MVTKGIRKFYQPDPVSWDATHDLVPIDVLGVRQDNDRQSIVDKPYELGAKPRHRAAVLHLFAIFQRSELPPEAVGM